MQGRLLAVLAANPERSYGLRELAELADTSPTTAQREVDRAEAAGIVTSRYEGRNRRIQINADHYLYQPLRQLLLATYGAPAILVEEFGDLDADLVILYGSWAARYEGHDGKPPNDIDVLIVATPSTVSPSTRPPTGPNGDSASPCRPPSALPTRGVRPTMHSLPRSSHAPISHC